MAKQKTKAISEFSDMASFSGMPSEAMQKAFQGATPFSGDMGNFARMNMQAMAKSLQVASKGMTQMNTKAFDFMQANLQRNLELAKTLGTTKMPKDMTALQELTKGGLQTYIEQMNEMGSLFTTTLREAAEPFSAQAGTMAKSDQTSA